VAWLYGGKKSQLYREADGTEFFRLPVTPDPMVTLPVAIKRLVPGQWQIWPETLWQMHHLPELNGSLHVPGKESWEKEILVIMCSTCQKGFGK
jgi:hypothetical protein